MVLSKALFFVNSKWMAIPLLLRSFLLETCLQDSCTLCVYMSTDIYIYTYGHSEEFPSKIQGISSQKGLGITQTTFPSKIEWDRIPTDP